MLPMTSTIWAYNEFLTGGLFKDADFPDGIDKELVIETIMIRNGELEPLYKDADFMQNACTSWTRKWYPSFERWQLALTESYDPLHNYDRYEDIDESSENSGTNTSTNTRSSFDSSSYEPHDQNNTNGNANGSFTRRAHLYGNIGVTTSAQMLEGELNIRKNTIYDLIADCFETELCLLIY